MRVSMSVTGGKEKLLAVGFYLVQALFGHPNEDRRNSTENVGRISQTAFQKK